MMIRAALLLLILFTFLPSVFADEVGETALDVQVREIAKTLRCTVCQTENIWESGAPLAKQMRDAIRERLELGQTEPEIRAYFLSRYGDYILMEPPKHGVNWLIWVAPFILLLVGGFFLYKEVVHWVKDTPTPPTQPLQPLDDQARKRLERELES
ncbi:MAG: cytochrome c-type biogenesis protein CcmH [Nitrospira sp.]|nr:cytochrome c-type biogenesis protein CcmH [Nitrospira sp.]MCB9710714.1 cytochrome c-type biogenesis protein CcmH [Nitrospiraceae bacterium]MDR4487737.1 cytochrome c-type biogenesis protein CcmH [Nitrospirales bacterium]MCA9467784.1 cytochrome c-type biogenesis protein CcmH [Nitrospira sp.]MCA9480233.1 cytochrome c-type biogenesis protein CcmH [Nitrospira sp.]